MCRTRVKRVLRGRDTLVPLPRSPPLGQTNASSPPAPPVHRTFTAASHPWPGKPTEPQPCRQREAPRSPVVRNQSVIDSPVTAPSRTVQGIRTFHPPWKGCSHARLVQELPRSLARHGPGGRTHLRGMARWSHTRRGLRPDQRRPEHPVRRPGQGPSGRDGHSPPARGEHRDGGRVRRGHRQVLRGQRTDGCAAGPRTAGVHGDGRRPPLPKDDRGFSRPGPHRHGT